MSDVLLAHAADLTDQLAAAHRELALTRCTELEHKASVWLSSGVTTASGREREADYQTHLYTQEVLRLKGEIQALIVELGQVDRQIAYREFLERRLEREGA